ncbi:MAG: glycosyltransferase [Bacteroidales bacterium]|nr:glycosyltransferase [Bacteroidales bacterium]
MKIFHLFDQILFVLMALTVFYLFVFSLYSMWNKKENRQIKKLKNRFVVLIPAYKEDSVIMESVNSVLNQDYPKNLLDIVVISDKMSEQTNDRLSKSPIKLLKINPETSSKAFAMRCAIDTLPETHYDIVVILDADNTVKEDFISRVNDLFNSGVRALQAHRMAKDTGNDMSVLDAISEEINNSIFRKGHTSLGLSSALIGSGMAFEFKWFRNNVNNLETSGEDKELELLLFKDRIYIEFAENLPVYDEKVKKEKIFYNQRRRWIATQFGSLAKGLKGLPKALVTFNFDYVDKVIQWMMLPRVVVLGLISVMAFISLLFDWQLTVKWIFLLICLIVTFLMAIPQYLLTKRALHALKRVPLIFLLMFANLFRTKGANKKFIHTQKG